MEVHKIKKSQCFKCDILVSSSHIQFVRTSDTKNMCHLIIHCQLLWKAQRVSVGRPPKILHLEHG
jgi:hypothetical protein